MNEIKDKIEYWWEHKGGKEIIIGGSALIGIGLIGGVAIAAPSKNERAVLRYFTKDSIDGIANSIKSYERDPMFGMYITDNSEKLDKIDDFAKSLGWE